jgi:hypothetical protein
MKEETILLGVTAVQNNKFLLLYEQMGDSHRLLWHRLSPSNWGASPSAGTRGSPSHRTSPTSSAPQAAWT